MKDPDFVYPFHFFLQKKYFQTLGGDDGDSFVRTCLKTIMTDRLASKFNLQGRNHKKSFIKFKIYKIIVGKMMNFEILTKYLFIIRPY